MAFPMVHLLAAHAWAQDKPELLACPEFYLGAISPDAIHVRDGNDKSNKKAVHLMNWSHFRPPHVHEYWGEHFSPFDVGYGIHALTDGLWCDMYRVDLPGLFDEAGHTIPDLYYNDANQTEHAIAMHRAEAQPILDLIKRAGAPGNHPLLSAEEIDAWRMQVLEYFTSECKHNAPVRFITEEYVADFIRRIQPILDEETGRYFP